MRKRSCPHTAHTANPVPVLLVERALRDSGRKLRDGSLRDVAPTLLGILGLDPPAAMSGRDLRPWVAAGRER